jgi:hypothetical protein
MTIHVPQPIEAWLLDTGNSALRRYIEQKLKQFTIDFVKLQKYSTNAFSKGFTFNNNQESTQNVTRLFKLVISNLEKRIPSLKEGTLYKYPFLSTTPYYGDRGLDINLSSTLSDMYDGSPGIRPSGSVDSIVLHRYFNRYFYSYCSTHRIPLKVEIYNSYSYGRGANDKTSLRINLVRSSHIYSLYLVVKHLPEILKALETLHRKACFNDRAIRREFSFKHTIPESSSEFVTFYHGRSD